MGVKVFVVILVVLAVLFVVGVAAPAVSGGNEQADPQGWLADTLRGLLERPVDLKADADVSPPECVQGRAIMLPAGGVCTLRLKADDAWFAPTRTLELEPVEGVVDVAQEGKLNIHSKLEPGDDPMTINVFKEGGTVTIACVGGLQACRLTLP